MLEQVIQFGNPTFGFGKCLTLAGKLRIAFPQAAVCCFLYKLGFVLCYKLELLPASSAKQFRAGQHFYRMGRTQIFTFPIGRTDKILLFFGKVRCAALIHLAATLCTIKQPGENTHIAHFGWAAA